MSAAAGKLSIKSKIWIEDQDGKVVFGSGRLYILDAVERHGSLHAAADELKMSYRAAWGKITSTEKRLGVSLLSRKPDGSKRSGSELTPLARRIVEKFRTLHRLIVEASDELFIDLFEDEFSEPADLGPADRQER